MTTDDIKVNNVLLRSIYFQITELNRRNALLSEKYERDEKFVRIHKRILMAYPDWGKRLVNIKDALLHVKNKTDEQILYQNAVLNNEPFFAKSVQPLVVEGFRSNALKLDTIAAKKINDLVVSEYIKEFRGATYA